MSDHLILVTYDLENVCQGQHLHIDDCENLCQGQHLHNAHF